MEKQNDDRKQSETSATCVASPPLSDLLSAITSAEERWSETRVSVEIFRDGSGFLQRDRRPAMEFTTIDKCFELLGR